MACDPEILKNVPLFALLDAEETAVLATQVELRNFAARERIYKRDQSGGQAYVLISGQVRVTTVDEDQQEVVVDEPSAGEFFGFASMLEQTAHHTSAIALEEESTWGERIADHVARFGGSWTFIITFLVLMSAYSGLNVLLGRGPGTLTRSSC